MLHDAIELNLYKVKISIYKSLKIMRNSFDLKKSFKNKKVLITGHTGFKGSWLAYLLYDIGPEVMGFALPPETEPNPLDLLGLSKKIKHVEGDIHDAKLHLPSWSFQGPTSTHTIQNNQRATSHETAPEAWFL